MSEQDMNPSSRLEAALLDQLARQEERISLLEARLDDKRRERESREEMFPEPGKSEDARRHTEPGEHSVRAMSFEAPSQPVRAMSFKAPAIRAMSFEAPDPVEPSTKTTQTLPSERAPVRLPEFKGPRMDAIAEAVFEKASERSRLEAVPDVLPRTAALQTPLVDESVEEGYERTARLNASLLRRQHQVGNASRKARLKTAGTLALLSASVAAIGVGLWQQRQTALLSASTLDTRPLTLLSPPSPMPMPRRPITLSTPRPLKFPSSTRQFGWKPPILEPQSEAPTLMRHERRPGSVAATAHSGEHSHLNLVAPHPGAHSHTISRGRHEGQSTQHKISVASTRGSKVFPVFPARQQPAGTAEHNRRFLSNAPTPDAFSGEERPLITRSDGNVSSDVDANPERPRSYSSSESPSYRAEEGDARRYVSDERRRAEAARNAVRQGSRHHRLESTELTEEAQSSGEESPRRRTQANTRRAIRTLQEMQALLDSIERRKRREANADSQ